MHRETTINSPSASEQLRSLAYASTVSGPVSENDLLRLVASAQRFNASVSVTGLLIYDDQGFLQTIEGPHSAVSQVFERIEADRTHMDIKVFVDEAIMSRLYPDWAMLNAHEHSAKTIQSMVQYALDFRLNDLATGQIEAATQALQRLSR